MLMEIPLTAVQGLGVSPDDGNQLLIVNLGKGNDLLLALASAKNEDLIGKHKT